MAGIQFKNNPVVDELQWASNNVTYQWDGQKWNTRLRPGINYSVNESDTVIVSSIAPTKNLKIGQLWFNNVNGRMYIYWNDGDSDQWTDISALGSSSPVTETGAKVSISETAPRSPEKGDLWVNSVEGRVFVYYQTPNSTYTWLDITGT